MALKEEVVTIRYFTVKMSQKIEKHATLLCRYSCFNIYCFWECDVTKGYYILSAHKIKYFCSLGLQLLAYQNVTASIGQQRSTNAGKEARYALEISTCTLNVTTIGRDIDYRSGRGIRVLPTIQSWSKISLGFKLFFYLSIIFKVWLNFVCN